MNEKSNPIDSTWRSEVEKNQQQLDEAIALLEGYVKMLNSGLSDATVNETLDWLLKKVVVAADKRGQLRPTRPVQDAVNLAIYKLERNDIAGAVGTLFSLECVGYSNREVENEEWQERIHNSQFCNNKYFLPTSKDVYGELTDPFSEGAI